MNIRRRIDINQASGVERATAPRRAAGVLGFALGLGVALLTGCGSGAQFKPLPLDAAVEKYRSTLSTGEEMVNVEPLPAGLRCTVLANPDPARSHSGGILLPCGGAKAVRMELAFPDRAGIVFASVNAYNAQKKRVARWQTGQWAPIQREKTSYVFIPQKSAKDFKPVSSDGAGEIHSIQVLVDLQRNTGAVFEVYNVEVAR